MLIKRGPLLACLILVFVAGQAAAGEAPAERDRVTSEGQPAENRSFQPQSAEQSNVAAGCAAAFIVADKDGDGALNGPERAASMADIPQSLAAKPQVSREEYLTACKSGGSTASE